MGKCIEWGGSVNSGGYGNRIFDGCMTGAHRAAYCEAKQLRLVDIAGLVVNAD